MDRVSPFRSVIIQQNIGNVQCIFRRCRHQREKFSHIISVWHRVARLIQAEEEKCQKSKTKKFLHSLKPSSFISFWNAMSQRQQPVKNVVEPAWLRYRVEKGLIAVNKNVQSQLDEALNDADQVSPLSSHFFIFSFWFIFLHTISRFLIIWDNLCMVQEDLAMSMWTLRELFPHIYFWL